MVKCKSCGLDVERFWAKGLCKPCYMRAYMKVRDKQATPKETKP